LDRRVGVAWGIPQRGRANPLGPGAKQNGPLLADMLDARAHNDDETVEENLLEDLAAETLVNEHALRHKDSMTTWALVLMMLAIVLDLTGVQ
jgi:hypothetical protein